MGMKSTEYRTEWQRSDDCAAIATLDRIDVELLPMREIHAMADSVLLDRVHPDVADAYARLRARAEAVRNDSQVNS
jgi:hypothetical protein